MSIKKILLLASMSLTAIAFAAPAAAQAQLLYEKGAGGSHEPLSTGAKITATSTNLITVTALGTLECEKVTIHGVVTTNSASDSHISNEATTVEGCNNPITNQNAGTITLTAGGGEAEGATFVAGGVCHFSGNIPFGYTTNTDVLTIEGENQLSGPCGAGTMSGDFTLETSNGTPVFIT